MSFLRRNVGGARVQIEFNSTNDLKREVGVISSGGVCFHIGIDYEFFPPCCDLCSVFGHLSGRCLCNPTMDDHLILYYRKELEA